MKAYGSYSEDDLNDWEKLPEVLRVLTSSGMGAWLRRRDERRDAQELKTGRWDCGDDMFEYAICSSCKHETGEAWEYAKRNFKYCPNCGCRMVEPQESEVNNG